MANILWIGLNDDWNDSGSWSGGVIPSPTDTVDFTSATAATVAGASYIGTLDISGANVTLAGDFSGDGTDAAAINDGPTNVGVAGSLTVDPWAAVAVSTLGLYRTFLDVQGSLSNFGGTIANGAVDGPSAEWLTSDTHLTGTLSVINGGITAGTLELGSGANLICDNASTLEDGALNINGDCRLSFVESASPSNQFILGDSLNISQDSTLTVVCPVASTIELNAGVNGPGTLDLSGMSLVLGTQFSLSSQLSIVNGSASATNMVSGTGTITLAQSLLDLHLDQASSEEALTVNCDGSENTVLGGSGNIKLNAGISSSLSFVDGAGSVTLSGGSAALTISGGSGAEKVFAGSERGVIHCSSGNDTVFGEAGSIYVIGGTGADQVWGGSSGSDTIIGGSGDDTLFGGTGAKVYAEGSGAAVLGTYATANGALLDASGSSGRDSLFAGGGSGIITMIGGSGDDLIVGGASVDSIRCGTGNTSVFSGSGFGDTIAGGDGSDVLVGGPGAGITIVGSAPNLAVSLGDGTTVDASHSAGSDTVFACGTGVTKIIGGSGSECIVGSTSYMSVVGGTGALAVWGGAGGHDTILGGAGNDTLVASSYSDVAAMGSGNNVLVSQGTGNTLDASRTTAANQFFLSGAGSTTVLFGSGLNELAGSGQSANVFFQGGQGLVWAGMGSLNLNITAQDVSGIIDIYQFNPSNSTIVLPTAQYEEFTSGGNMEIVCGSEKVVLEGITSLGQSHLSVKPS